MTHSCSGANCLAVISGADSSRAARPRPKARMHLGLVVDQRAAMSNLSERTPTGFSRLNLDACRDIIGRTCSRCKEAPQCLSTSDGISASRKTNLDQSRPTHTRFSFDHRSLRGRQRWEGLTFFRSKRQYKTRQLTVPPALDPPSLFKSRNNSKHARGTSSSTSAAPNSISTFR